MKERVLHRMRTEEEEVLGMITWVNRFTRLRAKAACGAITYPDYITTRQGLIDDHSQIRKCRRCLGRNRAATQAEVE